MLSMDFGDELAASQSPLNVASEPTSAAAAAAPRETPASEDILQQGQRQMKRPSSLEEEREEQLTWAPAWHSQQRLD